MKRVKRHRIKKEQPECSSFQQREQDEHDLAYYIHDRVELMHQVFSMLKYKELKTMSPDCVRNLAIGDLQELCTEELLGISSKRLLAILDGAEPPSDTESSSPSPPPNQLETISLDSISSDEELLASSSKKKKHKHRRHSVKSKSKKKDKSKQSDTQLDENAELSKASRAGLTVLELLELQARARAIRAQLQQEQANKLPSETTVVESSHHSSENEVEIKEEAPDVVEISSEDEKPDFNQLLKNIVTLDKTHSNEDEASKRETQTVKEVEMQSISQTYTKHINDLVITVPQAKPSRKIKLNRKSNKVIVVVPNNSETAPAETRNVTIGAKTIPVKIDNSRKMPETSNETKAKKKKKDKKKKTVEKDGSDHDEITLQLSDSEKMDLFEDLDDSRKNYDKVSSSSEDTESSSSDSNTENSSKEISAEKSHLFVQVELRSGQKIEDKEETTPKDITVEPLQSHLETELSTNNIEEKDKNNSEDTSMRTLDVLIETDLSSIENVEKNDDSVKNHSQTIKDSNNDKSKEIVLTKKQLNCKDSKENENVINSQTETREAIVSETYENSNEDQNNDSMLVNENTVTELEQNTSTHIDETSCAVVTEHFSDNELCVLNKGDSPSKPLSTEEKCIEIRSIEDIPVIKNSVIRNVESQKNSDKDSELIREIKKDLSDGELSDRQSSEVEAMDVHPEVVCISDEESPKKKVDKKKRKKDKKSKKDKKNKKSKSDFRKASDQNFYKDESKIMQGENQRNGTSLPVNEIANEKTIDLDSDEIYEILELSDDSSCYEVEGTMLSKEPTTEEIEALSAKIDEIEREEVVTDEQIRVHEQMLVEKETAEQSDENIGHISWKDRYLGSKKVKKVLTTANILNALRKKNKELKKKIEDSKNTDDKEILTEKNDPKYEINIQLEEGSIKQYNALQGSTKYINPVNKLIEKNRDSADNEDESEQIVTKAYDDENVTKEMKKDAKQLLKMYKRLLKHNDMNIEKDASKKKKKKQKKKVLNRTAETKSQIDNSV